MYECICISEYMHRLCMHKCMNVEMIVSMNYSMNLWKYGVMEVWISACSEEFIQI